MIKNPLIGFIKDLIYIGLESIGRYYSSYRGLVLDNNDPQNLNRLKLLIPQINGPYAHDYWAFPKGLFSGIEYGSQVLPQIGEMVWVEFEGGNAEIPIWQHGHRSKKEVPSDKALRDVNNFWFKSPKGHLVLINDTKNEIEIRSTTDGAISLTSSKINLGSVYASQKAVLGNKLFELLKTHIEDLQEAKTITGGTFTPDTIAKLKITGTKLGSILSDKVKLD